MFLGVVERFFIVSDQFTTDILKCIEVYIEVYWRYIVYWTIKGNFLLILICSCLELLMCFLLVVSDRYFFAFTSDDGDISESKDDDPHASVADLIMMGYLLL